MIKRKDITLLALIFGCIVLFSAINAAAQPIEDREPLKLKSTVRFVGVKPVIKRPIRKNRTADSSLLVKSTPKRPTVVTDRTSDLTIETQPNATVTMTPERKGAKPIVRKAVNGKAKFDNLQPGRYAISASLDEFIEQETEVAIEAQKTATLNFPLEPIQYQLNINTNIPDGEVRYAPAALVEEKSAGSVKLKPEGNYCIVQIKDNKAKITGLKKGYYTIDINPGPNAIQYDPIKAAITPDLIVDEEDETEGLKFVDIALDTKLSTTTFAPSLQASNEWQMPQGWKLDNKMSTAGLNGIALPKNELYRYYTDFELVTDVRSLDGKTVGFALRAIDTKNYYLIQIGGDKAAGRYLVTGFVVKDGIPTQLVSYNISAFDTVINDKKSFRVIIKAKDNVFKIFIEKRGTPQPLGDITDGFRNFKKGAVGIAEIANSNFEVNFFTVCSSSCVK